MEDMKTPVVLSQHYGWDGFSFLWWTETERRAFYEVIKNYNILGIFHGHSHGVEKRIWNGIPIWVCGSPQKMGKPGDFLVARIKHNKHKVYHRQNHLWHQIPKNK